MKELPAWLKEYLLERYKHSSYANFLQMEILDLCAGETTVSMFVGHELTNLSHILHGGAVGSLLDMAMNLACFSTGRHATVLGFNTNFLGGAREGETVRAVATVLHSGRSTMVVESRIIDGKGKLLAKGRGTFLATEPITPEDQPLKKEPSPYRSSDRILSAVESRAIDTPEAPKVEEWLKAQLLSIHDRNFFAKYLGMEIVHIGKGHTVVSMLVMHKHTNIRGLVHGGALVSLGDMSMMLACASLGKRTVTLDLNINFVRRANEGDTIKSFTKVIHKGKTTMVVSGSTRDETGALLAEARGTFFVTGDFTPEAQLIPPPG